MCVSLMLKNKLRGFYDHNLNNVERDWINIVIYNENNILDIEKHSLSNKISMYMVVLLIINIMVGNTTKYYWNTIYELFNV